MNVVVDGQFYDANKIPILYLLNDDDKLNIGNMGSKGKYFCFPGEWEQEAIELMEEEFRDIMNENGIK